MSRDDFANGDSENLAFGLRLQTLREGAGLSQGSLGTLSGVAQSIICELELGKLMLSGKVKTRLLKVLPGLAGWGEHG